MAHIYKVHIFLSMCVGALSTRPYKSCEMCPIFYAYINPLYVIRFKGVFQTGGRVEWIIYALMSFVYWKRAYSKSIYFLHRENYNDIFH